MLESNGFYASLQQALDRVMGIAHRRGVFKEDVDQVLLVGGTSLMPAIQRTLQSYFSSTTAPDEKDLSSLPAWPQVAWTRREIPVRVDKPFTAIVEGALQVAGGAGLDDYLVHSYGLRHLDPASGKRLYDEIIPMGTRYPMSKGVEVLLSAAYKNQAEIEFVIGQMDSSAASTVEVRYEDGQAVFVAQAGQAGQKVVELNARAPTIVRLSPFGAPGEQRLKATLTVDAERRLHLSVTDLKTRQELLKDVVITTLGEGEAVGKKSHRSSGREPSLAAAGGRGSLRLSLRGLATALNLLSPEAVSLDTLAQALCSPDFAVRYTAAELLARRGDRDARRIYEEVFAKAEPPVRASAAHHLHAFSWFAAEPLYLRALTDPDLRVREGAIFSLCKLRTPDGYRLLAETLPGAGEALNLAAAWGLSTTPDSAAIPVLALTLQARDAETRDIALEALGQIRSSAALPVVRQALNDSEPQVVYSAVLSMVELAGADCLPELAEQIRLTNSERRRSILRGLFHATNYLQIHIGETPAAEQVVEALEGALNDDLPAVRIAAAMLLAWMRHPRAEVALAAAFQREADGETKAHLLFAAVSLMSPVGEALLREAQTSPEKAVRETAEYLINSRK